MTHDPLKSLSLANLDPLRALKAARLDQYLGLWLMHEDTFRVAWQHVQKLDLRTHVRDAAKRKRSIAKVAAGGSVPQSKARDQVVYPVTSSGIAIVELNGSLMKMQSSLSNSTSTVFARRQIRLAAADDQVVATLVKVDSPGGTMAGTGDLADDIAMANQQKPCWAYIEDMGCSGGYWPASSAAKVFANATAAVGSIGTYMVVTDSSQAAASEGIKVHVVRAGDMKGVGVPGTEVTPEQLAEIQRFVNAANDQFILAVSRGRRMSLDAATALADGRVHVGAEAQALGLIDGVQSLDDTLDQLAAAASAKLKTKTISVPTARGAKAMATETKQTETQVAEEPRTIVAASVLETSATYHDLLTACEGAEEKFLCSQLAVKATVEQAQKAWMKEQGARLKASQEELEKARATPPKRPGIVTPVKTGPNAKATETTGDALTEFDALVEEQLTKHKGNRTAAVSAAVRKNPELHAQYVRSFNQARGRDLNKITGLPSFTG
ncbi:MAG TPA: S49 family peptidase [Pirellulales bacterium]|jgi:signal peptide peptidase SppA